jgi:hypothetical protein
LGDAWDAVTAAIARARERVRAWQGLSPEHRAEGERGVARLVASGIAVCVEHADALHPSFVRMIAPDMKWGLDMPDCVYLYASVEHGGTYRIAGTRGSANHFDVQVNAGHFAAGEIGAWRTVASLAGHDLAPGPKGEIEIVLSAARPEPAPAVWLPLEPGVEFVLVRQYFGDWSTERPAALTIEREDAPAASRPLDPAVLDARLRRLAAWIDRTGGLWDRMARGFLGLSANSVIVHDPGASAEHVGLRDQIYAIGNYQCGQDEAVVVTFEAPRCHHLSASLASRFFESHEYARRQGSLNHTQLARDTDGRVRLVIAQRDPGVANWLDACGHEHGLIALRFLLAEGAAPEPAFERVPLAQLIATLPADTPRVDPVQRDAILRARARGVARRFPV